jgi:N-acyl homoserine lactone hydrolase
MVGVHLLIDGLFTANQQIFLPEGQSIPYVATSKSLLIVTKSEKILVDTGIGSKPKDRRYEQVRRDLSVNRKKGQGIKTQLARHGIKPEEITIVVNTHLHGAHSGGNKLFKEAKFYVSSNEFRFIDKLVGNDPNQTAYIPEYFDDLRDVAEVKGDYKLTDEVTILPTPGHTLGHQSVIVKLNEKNTLVYSGDVSPLRENLEKKIAMSSYDRQMTLKSMEKLLRIKDAKWVFSHDSDQLTLRKLYLPS